MLNLSKLARNSAEFPLKVRAREFVDPEIYLAEDIKDYRENKSLIVPPWFKKNPFSSAGLYALIAFHNVGIDGILNGRGGLVKDLVKVHDGSGSTVMCWNEPGEMFASHKSYFQRLEDGELLLQDWVYGLTIVHSYHKGLPFVSEIEKSKFTRTKRKKSSLMDRINSLFPDLVPAPQPSY